MSVTARQIELVQQSWEKVVPIADTAAQLFYGKLFAEDPRLRALFKQDMADQRRKLMATIGLAVKNLNDLHAVVPLVQQLGQRHVGYGVRDEDYDTVAGALLWTLEQGLGPDFDAETREAWTQVYGLLASTMKDAAKDVAA